MPSFRIISAIVLNAQRFGGRFASEIDQHDLLNDFLAELINMAEFHDDDRKIRNKMKNMYVVRQILTEK